MLLLLLLLQMGERGVASVGELTANALYGCDSGQGSAAVPVMHAIATCILVHVARRLGVAPVQLGPDRAEVAAVQNV